MKNEKYDDFEPEVSFLNEIPKIMPYSIPSGYFLDFNNNLEKVISVATEKYNNVNWGKELPYQVPDDYFEHLPNKVIEAVYEDEDKPLFSRNNVMHVPDKYFEELPVKVLCIAKETNKKSAKTIQLIYRFLLRPTKYAIAAIMVLGIGLGVIVAIISNSDKNPEKMMASVPKKDINEYVQQNYIDVDLDIVAVKNDNSNNALRFDNKEIIQYLNETGWDGVE